MVWFWLGLIVNLIFIFASCATELKYHFKFWHLILRTNVQKTSPLTFFESGSIFFEMIKKNWCNNLCRGLFIGCQSVILWCRHYILGTIKNKIWYYLKVCLRKWVDRYLLKKLIIAKGIQIILNWTFRYEKMCDYPQNLTFLKSWPYSSIFVFIIFCHLWKYLAELKSQRITLWTMDNTENKVTSH